MSHPFVDRRDGRVALYLGGDLQFDSADERRYHEPLGLVPVALAGGRAPGRALRVLILGGGDGLVLREILRAPAVGAVHLVDRDPEVLTLGRRDFAVLNARAFDDPRVTVHAEDARQFIARARRDVAAGAPGFDAVVCDLTYPRDVAGASVHTVEFYDQVRAALTTDGVLAVNAVSPELTPEAFGSIAATLGAAGLASVPYAFALPSFASEGYGRWGFLFASRRLITDAELGSLALPAGVGLTVADLRRGMELPVAAAAVMRVAANRSDEILYYIANASPLAWAAPWTRVRFEAAASPAPGPRLTVAEGFGRWLRQDEGRRTLDALLACLPVGQRDPARQLALEWAHHAEAMCREVDLAAFVERAIMRAASLPEGWRRELAELAARIRDGLPSMRDLLQATWRVFAVFLLALLLANILFPDNLYAKGSRSGVSRPGSEQSDDGMASFAPSGPIAPFRHRAYSQHRPSGPYGRTVAAADGKPYDTAPILFADPERGRRPVGALLALTPTLRLLDDGVVTYFVPVAAHYFLLHPDRLEVMVAGGERVLSLHPGDTLVDEASRALAAQSPLVERALGDHRRWVEWSRWGARLPAGREATVEMLELQQIQRSLDRARVVFSVPLRPPAFQAAPGWRPLLPGVFVDGSARAVPSELLLVDSDGVPRRRRLDPPATVGEVDRFIFALMHWRLGAQREPGFGRIVERWRQAHGDALVVPGGWPR